MSEVDTKHPLFYEEQRYSCRWILVLMIIAYLGISFYGIFDDWFLTSIKSVLIRYLIGSVLAILVLIAFLRSFRHVCFSKFYVIVDHNQVQIGFSDSDPITFLIHDIVRVDLYHSRALFFDPNQWDIRRDTEDRSIFLVNGNKGVTLELADGKKILIGTQRPQELERAIHKAKEQSGAEMRMGPKPIRG